MRRIGFFSFLFLGSFSFAAEEESSMTVIAIGAQKLVSAPMDVVINHVAINSRGIAIIGGYNGSEDMPIPYAAMLSETGSLSPLTSLLMNGCIQSVAINSEGGAIVGGYQGTPSMSEIYASLISSSGEVNNLTSMSKSGCIRSVAINKEGDAIVGGYKGPVTMPTPYTALISSSGSVMEIPLLWMNGVIQSVSISNQGIAIIKGDESPGTMHHSYAALVSPQGTVTYLSPGFLPKKGEIRDVAMNDRGSAVLGGFERSDGAMTPYVAFVSEDGTISPLPSDVLPAAGLIDYVAITGQGAAIIAGIEAHASLPVSTSPIMKMTLLPSAMEEMIQQVPEMNFDQGMMSFLPEEKALPEMNLDQGMMSFLPEEKALPEMNLDQGMMSLLPEEKALPEMNLDQGVMSLLPEETALPEMSLDQGAMSLLPETSVGPFVMDREQGGKVIVDLAQARDQIEGTPYVALVSPSGVVTKLESVPTMNLTALNAWIANLISAIEVKSFGPNWASVNAFYSMSEVLSGNLFGRRVKFEPRSREAPQEKVALLAESEFPIIADREDKVRLCRQCAEKRERKEKRAAEDYSIWVAPVGARIHQKQQGAFPQSDTNLVGGLAAFDYRGFSESIFGGGLAYSFDSVHVQNRDKAKIQQGWVVVYENWADEDGWMIEGALWGGGYQVKNRRKTLHLTSKSSYVGWQLNPHVEFAKIFMKNCISFSPFVRFDWANQWQEKVREKGGKGFDLHINSSYVSMLRSELGFHCAQWTLFDWGRVQFEEKLSYVNKAPFHANTVGSRFVGASFLFPVEVYSNTVENLGLLQAAVILSNINGFFGGIRYQGQFGFSENSQSLWIEFGGAF